MSTFAPDTLFRMSRNRWEEIRIDGQIVVVHGSEVIFASSERMRECPARSTLKPFQFLATGLVAEFKKTAQPRYIPCAGSISATAFQVEEIEKWYDDETFRARTPFLKFEPMWPRDEVHRVQLQVSGKPQKPTFHYCFSKHMAILEACDRNGWDRATYNSPSHPYFARLSQIVSDRIGDDIREWVTDGCKLPTPVLPLSALARLYQKLATEGGELGTIRDMMLASPDWIAGPDRVDTELMQQNPGQLVAKEGADGLLAVGVLPTKKYPQGLGFVIKTSGGWLPQYTTLALAPLFDELGLKYQCEVPHGQNVTYGYRPFQKSAPEFFDISPTLSESTAVWPGDKPFRRSISMDTINGDHMSLSSVETTVHVGAHTDAPNHFEKNKVGIDAVDLEKYWGPCQVIQVDVPRGKGIAPSDLKGQAIRAPRVLFKTNSFPDPNDFNEDFVALSAPLVEYLAGKGVKLVGIDTPSIDLFASKDLLTHHATTQYNVAILEGIVLKDIDEGIYELMAAPLKIRGGDASPVRAILFKV